MCVCVCVCVCVWVRKRQYPYPLLVIFSAGIVLRAFPLTVWLMEFSVLILTVYFLPPEFTFGLVLYCDSEVYHCATIPMCSL